MGRDVHVRHLLVWPITRGAALSTLDRPVDILAFDDLQAPVRVKRIKVGRLTLLRFRGLLHSSGEIFHGHEGLSGAYEGLHECPIVEPVESLKSLIVKPVVHVETVDEGSDPFVWFLPRRPSQPYPDHTAPVRRRLVRRPVLWGGFVRFWPQYLRSRASRLRVMRLTVPSCVERPGVSPNPGAHDHRVPHSSHR